MNNNIKISVITGIYYPNETLFRKFLDSCLNQSLDSVQFVFVFDDPKDKQSRIILEEYKDKIQQNKSIFTILENNKNLGIYATQMRGLQNALGQYIVFFDNDDFFDSDYLQVMYEYATKFDANVIKGYAITHFYGNTDINFAFLCKESSVFNNDDWLYMYKRTFFDRFFNQNTMYKSDSKKLTPITENIIGKEEILEIPFWEGTFYHYVRHESNTSNVLLAQTDQDRNIDDTENQTRIRKRFWNTLNDVFGAEINSLSKEEIECKIKEFIDWDDSDIKYTYDDIKDI